MPLTGGLTRSLPINSLTNNVPLNKLTGLPVSGLAGQIPVVGPMAQNLPVVNQLSGKDEPTPAEDAAAGQNAAAALKNAFQAPHTPHMPTPPALMRPAHTARSREVAPAAPAAPAAPGAPIAPTVTAPTVSSAPAPAAPPAAKPASPLSNLPLVGGLTSGLPVSGLIPGF
jgi:hypothetical protein